MNHTTRASFSIALAFAFTSYVVASPLAGAPVLANADEVSVNHVRVIAGAGLRVGDLLQTAAGGTALLTLGKATAAFGHLTAVEIEPSAVRLNHGYLHVNGPLTVLQAGYTATPAANSEYEFLTLASGRSYVRVYRGSVALTGFARPVTVTAGSAVSYDAPQAQAGAAASQAGAGAGGAGAAAGAAGAGAAAGAGLATATIITVAAVGAAVAATAIVVAQTTNSSPTQP